MPTLRKIDCVLLHADDLNAAVAYYERAFGLGVRWRAEHQVGLGMPETDAEIVLYDGPPIPPGANVHYLVDDVRLAVAELVAQGCVVDVAPFEIAVGWCAVIRDPFGNALSLLDATSGPRAGSLSAADE